MAGMIIWIRGDEPICYRGPLYQLPLSKRAVQLLVILWNLLKTKKSVHQQKQTTNESNVSRAARTSFAARGRHVRHLWFRLNFVKNVCLNYYSRHLVLFKLITPESSNEFPWISIRQLVKPRANYCVDTRITRWVRPAFAESYRLLRVALSKELLAVDVVNVPDQWHNRWVAGVRTAPLPS